ncbi:MAG TPA: type II toxin-antitoxin system VapC family toxin [Thermoanaerobaculia bacterium]
MKTAYIDSSCFISIALGEPGSRELMARLSRCEELFSSNLLEAEFRAALAREGLRSQVTNLLSWVRWVFPKRRLTPELDQILGVCGPKGADLWHLACALFLKRQVGALFFLTLDRRQNDNAQTLGLRGL